MLVCVLCYLMRMPIHLPGSVKPRPHEIAVTFSHNSTAYIDEPYPIVVDVVNHDDRDLLFTMDALLQPGEDDVGMLYILFHYHYVV